MTTFTLGTKPPHIDHVRTFADTDEDIVMMEWKISFVPNDIANMTTAAAERKINPKIVLNIRLGIGPAVVGKDIVVEDLSFQGTMVRTLSCDVLEQIADVSPLRTAHPYEAHERFPACPARRSLLHAASRFRLRSQTGRI